MWKASQVLSELKKAFSWFKTYIKDTVIIGILLVLLAYVGIRAGLENSVDSIFSRWVLVIFGYAGLIDLCYRLGWTVLVPNYILKATRTRFAHDLMKEFFIKDREYIKSNDQARIEFTLEQLGLSQSAYCELRNELLEIRMGHLGEPDEAEKKLQDLLKLPKVIVEQESDSYKRAYPEVRRYIDFVRLTGSQDYLLVMTSIYFSFLKSALGKKGKSLDDIHRVIIPYDGNILLLAYVCQKLGKPYVITRKDAGRIVKEEAWDGDLHSGENLILLTDVIVTGRQLITSIEKIVNVKHNCVIVGVFGLVQRKEYMGDSAFDELKELQNNYSVETLAYFDDNDLGLILNRGSGNV